MSPHSASPFSYDALPYAGHPHPDAHPARAGAIARLFGVPVVELAHARVLELGCGQGDDLLPLAAAYPAATFVGIDLGSTHIRVAEERRRARGLENLQFVQGDVARLGDDVGESDFVVANGLYSWVPEPVADAVLAVCARMLARSGIAYVSYNTYPGWHELGSARAALRAHAGGVGSPRAQVRAARAFLAEATGSEADDPDTRSLRRVARRVASAADSYLFHEFLCEHNHPVRLTEFARRAASHGLRYVGDVLASAMWGTEPGDGEDRVAYEQGLDDASGRGFRGSILCRRDVPVRTAPDAGALRSLALASRLRHDHDGVFAGEDGLVLELEGDGIVAALAAVCAAEGRAIPFDPAWCALADAGTVLDDLLALVQAGLIEARLSGGPEATRVEERPQAFSGAQADLAEGRTRVGGLRHVSVDLDPAGRALLPRLDGTHDRAALVAALRTAAQGGAPELAHLSRLPDAELRAQLETWLRHALASGLLVGRDGS